MGLVEAIHPVFGTIDYRQPMSKLVFIGGSLLFFTAVFAASSLGSNGLKHYRKLRRREKFFWNMAVVRALCGILWTVVGIWAIWWEEVFTQDVVHATTPTGYVSIYVITGFFLYDTLVYMTYDLMFGTFHAMSISHHFISILCYSLSVYYECCHSFALGVFLLEMSVPFSSVCWVLLKCGLADSLAWKVNQMILIRTYHLRSIHECYLWLQVYRNWSHMLKETPFPLLATQLGGLFMITFVMTPYWAYKKTAQLFNPVDWISNDRKKA